LVFGSVLQNHLARSHVGTLTFPGDLQQRINHRFKKTDALA
jgi:hypothetical protein